jgi:excinuclease UvrABC ATPase subunit
LQDVRTLLGMLHRLVEQGEAMVMIEHSLGAIKTPV